MTVFEDPSNKTLGYCQTEWAVHGTCCEPKSLVAYAEADSKKIQNNVRNVAKEFASLMQFSRRIYKVMLSISQLSKYKWQPLVKDPVMIQKLEKLIKDINERIIHRDIFYTFLSRKSREAFGPKLKKCWSKMSQIRNSVLCTTCSGESYRYFVNKKANVAESVCHRILGDCWANFRQLTMYTSRLLSIYELNKMQKEYGKELIRISGSRMYWFSVKKLHEEMAKVKINFLVKNYSPYSSKMDQKEKKTSRMITRALCRRFIKLQGETVLSQLDKAIAGNQFEASLGDLTSKLVGMHRKKTGEASYENLIKSKRSHNIEVANKKQKVMSQVQLKYLIEEEEKEKLNYQEALTKKISMYQDLSRTLNLKTSSRNLDIEGSLTANGQPTKEPTQFPNPTEDSRTLNLDSEMNILRGSDSMFTSFEGAHGTGVFHDNNFAKTLNLTLRFP